MAEYGSPRYMIMICCFVLVVAVVLWEGFGRSNRKIEGMNERTNENTINPLHQKNSTRCVTLKEKRKKNVEEIGLSWNEKPDVDVLMCKECV